LLLLSTVYAYVIVIIKVGEMLKARGFHPSVTRKLIHLFAGDSIVAIGWFSSAYWPALIPGGLLLLLFLLLFSKRDHPMIQSMFFSEKGGWHNYGPLYYITSILLLLFPFWNRKDIIVASTYVMAWGDGLAPLLVSRIRRRHTYPWSDRSLEGSLILFFFGFLGAVLGLFILSLSPNLSIGPADIIIEASIASLIGTIIEALTMGPLEAFDNFTVPILTAVTLYFV
jgi:dolichol kinase